MAARTCTTFQGPALDHLWSSTDLFRLLTRCMPSDLWAVDDVTRDWTKKTRMRLLRPVRASDWDRLRSYARRVRHLSSTSNAAILTDVFPTLSVSLPKMLFPNLHSLTWRHYGADFHYINLFLHPTVTKIVFRVSSDSEASILSALAADCPNLADISIETLAYYAKCVSDFVRGLPCARKISAHSLDGDVLEHLSHLSSLQSLALHQFSSPLTLSSANTGTTFTALRNLTLSYPDITDTTQFLGLFKDVPLHTANIDFDEFVTAAEIHDLYAALSAGLSHSSFRDLSMEVSCPDESEADLHLYLIPPRSVRLLFCFSGLTSLCLTCPMGFDLDNAAVEELACAWPQIETLQLSGLYPRHAPRATLACLQSFSRHCPRLCVLTFAIDATATPSVPVHPGTRLVQQHTLQKLDIVRSPLGSSTPISVARFLSALFPRLERIRTEREWDENDDEDELLEHGDAIRLHRRWKEVQALLPDVLAIREEGRLLAQEPSN
ncbi:hypothetical protein MVEN_00491200 [Mycena venus]|uniref:F-box domain-containing protein n=1 Tax=Mycena venus TaxID=2733690 RepID=A0A8H6YTP3_9AGAR|nr:hypothetical protein MVEN_00491200 [Mycena venus]